jgi:hypothetical protein
MEGDPDGQVWPNLEVWNESRGGQTFRADLVTAGIERPSLFSGNEDTLPADFRALRTTGAMWAALSGLDGRALERRIGHSSGTASTDRYVGVAEDVTGGAIGTPFPPLPDSLISATLLATKNTKPRFRGAFTSGEGGIRNLHAEYTEVTNGTIPASSLPEVERLVTDDDISNGDVTEKMTETLLTVSALEFALVEASKGGRFDVVAQLATELQARRLASEANAVPLGKRGAK